MGDNNTQTNVDAADLPPPQRVGAGTTVHNLPAGSALFVGRDLGELDRLLHGTSAGVVVGQAAVHGLGGIGKTELALRFARANLHRYRLVWWVIADGPANIEAGLAELTGRLHPVATLADAQRWAVGWLQSHSDWLLILDNVEVVEHIRPLLGLVAGRGRVLVTTRRDLGVARWRILGLAPLRLGTLDRAACIEFLVRATGEDDPEAAGRLAAVLGDLPLALEQAAAWLGQHPGVGYDGYRERLDEQFAHFSDAAGEGGNRQRTLARVWRITMETIASRVPLAAQVLGVSAWLAPEGVPVDLLRPMADDAADIEEAVALLASYNMIDHHDGVIDLHRLVQAVTRTSAEHAVATAVSLTRRYAPSTDIWVDPTGWPRWTALLPHIDALVSSVPPERHDADLLHLDDRAAVFRHGQGQLTLAIAQFERAVAERRRVWGDEHPATAVSLNNLAGAYETAGRVAEAVALYERALAVRRTILGEDHPDTLECRGNLAGAYRLVGRSDEAIAMYEALLVDCRRVWGENGRWTLNFRSGLARAFLIQGRFDEAVVRYEAVFADFRRVLGEDHPDTLICGANLARSYMAVGRADEAVALYELVVISRRRVLGETHPHTLASRANLAYGYWSAGRTVEATAMLEQAFADAERVCGADHPVTRTIAGHLGRIGEVAVERIDRRLHGTAADASGHAEGSAP